MYYGIEKKNSNSQPNSIMGELEPVKQQVAKVATWDNADHDHPSPVPVPRYRSHHVSLTLCKAPATWHLGRGFHFNKPKFGE